VVGPRRGWRFTHRRDARFVGLVGLGEGRNIGSDARGLQWQITGKDRRAAGRDRQRPLRPPAKRGKNLFTSVDGRRVTFKFVPQSRRTARRSGGLAGTGDLTRLASDDHLLVEHLEQGPAQDGPAERLVAASFDAAYGGRFRTDGAGRVATASGQGQRAGSTASWRVGSRRRYGRCRRSRRTVRFPASRRG